jgi:chaperonin GroEL
MKKVLFQTDRIIKGANDLCDLLKMTIGPMGHNVIIDSEYGKPIITNDGFTISEAFQVKDKEEQAGADIVRDSLQSTNDNAGDGRTTCAVLTQAILNGGLEHLKNTLGADPIKLRAEIIEAKDKVIELMTPKDCESAYEVARISSKSDYLGRIVADAIGQVGKDGIVKVEDGDKDEVIVVKGYEIESGTEPVEMESADLVIMDENLDSIDQVKRVIDQKIAEGSSEILIIANDYNYNVEKFIKMNSAVIKIALIKSPGYAKSRRNLYDDLSIVKDKIQVSVSEDRTLLIGLDADERIKELEKERPTDEFDKEQREERIAKLQGKIALIKVTAKTNTELVEKEHHLKDAIKATQSALDMGVVKGGGMALYEVSIPEDTVGAKILSEAIKAPYKQININGFKFTDTDVVDSYKVIKSALENAVSVATSLLTTGGALIEDETKPS